jgi:hypothetical protein
MNEWLAPSVSIHACPASSTRLNGLQLMVCRSHGQRRAATISQQTEKEKKRERKKKSRIKRRPVCCLLAAECQSMRGFSGNQTMAGGGLHNTRTTWIPDKEQTGTGCSNNSVLVSWDWYSQIRNNHLLRDAPLLLAGHMGSVLPRISSDNDLNMRQPGRMKTACHLS